jgi:integrase
MNKRGNGEGSIRKRSNGTWEGRYSAGRDPETGTLIRRSVYASTRKECADKLAEKQRITNAHGGLYVASERLTVADWLHVYLWEIKAPTVKPGTFQQYVYLTESFILTAPIAQMKIQDVRRPHAQSFVDGLTSANVKPFMTRNIFGVLRNAFAVAEQRGFVPVSYLSNIALPKRQPRPTQILTRSEQATLLSAIAGHRLEAAFIIALTTGPREGEIAALMWDDYKDGTIAIKRNAIRASQFDPVTKEKSGTEIIIQDTPKTAAGVRKLPLLPIAVKALAAHRVRQNDERVQNRLLYQDNGLIFCSEIGTIYEPEYYRKTLQKILVEHELPKIKFHALRHTFATRGLEADISTRSMQALLGHESPDMTMHYQHLLEEHAEVEIAKLKDVFPL